MLSFTTFTYAQKYLESWKLKDSEAFFFFFSLSCATTTAGWAQQLVLGAPSGRKPCRFCHSHEHYMPPPPIRYIERHIGTI